MSDETNSSQEPPRPPDAGCYDVRCFRRDGKGKLRSGLWLMTRPKGRRGAFFHGERDEIQTPHYTLEELSDWSTRPDGFIRVQEITPAELLAELENWPRGLEMAQDIIDRHRSS